MIHLIPRVAVFLFTPVRCRWSYFLCSRCWGLSEETSLAFRCLKRWPQDGSSSTYRTDQWQCKLSSEVGFFSSFFLSSELSLSRNTFTDIWGIWLIREPVESLRFLHWQTQDSQGGHRAKMSCGFCWPASWTVTNLFRYLHYVNFDARPSTRPYYYIPSDIMIMELLEPLWVWSMKALPSQ